MLQRPFIAPNALLPMRYTISIIQNTIRPSLGRPPARTTVYALFGTTHKTGSSGIHRCAKYLQHPQAVCIVDDGAHVSDAVSCYPVLGGFYGN